MPDYPGYYQYLTGGAAAPQEGECRIELAPETLTVAPASAAPFTIDLGDLAGVAAANFQIRLPLDNGHTLVLKQLAKAYDRISRDLLESYRRRAVQCLLLEDMEEIGRYPGAFERYPASAGCSSCGARNHGTKFCPECGALVTGSAAPASVSGEAEICLYKTNLAVLPSGAQGFQWRLAEVDAVRGKPGSLDVTLESGDDRLRLYQLGRRTNEFAEAARTAIGAVNAHSAQALHATFPFLAPDQLQATAALWREGRAASIARLNAIHPRMGSSLAANAVDTDLKPYFEELVRRTATGMLYAGFKLIRPEEKADAETPEESETATPDGDETGPETLYWFFFPLAKQPGSPEPANLVAWEASSRSGRATYFFRLVDPSQEKLLQDPKQAEALVDHAIRRLNRVLGMLNFRRRPIYLSDSELETNPLYRRYAIACRRIPEVREVRASFVGRAIHVSPEAWLDQINGLVAKADK